MKGIKSVIGVVLALVVLGNIVSLAMAKQMEATTSLDTEKCLEGQVTTMVQHKLGELSITEIKGRMTYIKALNAFKESAKLRKYIEHYKPMYDKAKVYILKYGNTPTEVIRIPLKGEKPAVFIFAKGRYNTVILIKIVDTKSQEVRYYLYNGGKIKTKVFSYSIDGNADVELGHSGFISPLWVSTPGSGGGTHEKISYQSAKALDIPEEYRNILRDHSGDPDRYDQGWDRIWKHGYCPVGPWGFGGAPDACNKNVTDALNSFRDGKYTDGYKHLAHALHYLQDVGNPYHTTFDPLYYPNHVYYENLVDDHWSDWNLDNTVYYAQTKTVSSPKSAVVSLARYSYNWLTTLDWAIDLYRATGDVKYLNTIKSLTTMLIGETAGYTKGLIKYTLSSI